MFNSKIFTALEVLKIISFSSCFTTLNINKFVTLNENFTFYFQNIQNYLKIIVLN